MTFGRGLTPLPRLVEASGRAGDAAERADTRMVPVLKGTATACPKLTPTTQDGTLLRTARAPLYQKQPCASAKNQPCALSGGLCSVTSKLKMRSIGRRSERVAAVAIPTAPKHAPIAKRRAS